MSTCPVPCVNVAYAADGDDNDTAADGDYNNIVVDGDDNDIAADGNYAGDVRPRVT